MWTCSCSAMSTRCPTAKRTPSSSASMPPPRTPRQPGFVRPFPLGTSLRPARLLADFNGLFGDLLCLSHTDACTAEDGTAVALRPGMRVTVVEEDYEDGERDDLIATGTVEPLARLAPVQRLTVGSPNRPTGSSTRIGPPPDLTRARQASATPHLACETVAAPTRFVLFFSPPALPTGFSCLSNRSRAC